jgi:DmsE family decaheme c-type cytochrome
MRRRTLLAAFAVGLALAWPGLTQESGPVCADCHDEVAAGMSDQIHMRIEPFEVGGRTVGCEGCHGDGTAHMEEGDPDLIRTFVEMTSEDSDACMRCHNAKGMSEWHASTHSMEGVACFECHSIHDSKKRPLDSCRSCHQETYAQFELPNHHPVREGRMNCVSCHNPHRATEYQLNTDMRLNDLCYTCHQAKEGPFIFEHEPVVEDCRLCHVPHGSVTENLLTANEPMLCLQCHEFHFHAGLVSPEGAVDVGGFERENPHGIDSMNVAFTTRCSQCHSQVHGTDLPSQALASSGHGMVR